MEQQYLPARLKRAACRCRVQVVERSETLGAMSKQSVWLRCICVYQLITAETHAVGRHHPVDPVASCLFERSEMLAVVKVRWE